MLESIKTFLDEHIASVYGDLCSDIVILAGIAVVAVIFYFVTIAILRMLEKLVSRTETEWDDDLLNPAFLKAVSQLSPAIIVKWLLPGFFGDGNSYRWLAILTTLYIAGAVVWILLIFIRNLYSAFFKRPNFRAYAVKGIFQMAQLVIIGVAAIYAVSIIAGKSPAAILTALGASAAVLMLIFKDTILGLVASVQLTANKMIHRGDWIICDKHNANGEVVDISLTTIKVQNWDNSITTIPPYILISESFRNYQPMRHSGGRRVSRSILIDANSVRFLSPDELDALRDRGWLKGLKDDGSDSRINLRMLRNYLDSWLSSDPRVNKEMLLMVRQMEPTSAGLPLQLYFFCNEVRWREFEQIQSDIFDHVYAVIGEFGLRVFQTPAGADLKTIGQAK